MCRKGLVTCVWNQQAGDLGGTGDRARPTFHGTPTVGSWIYFQNTNFKQFMRERGKERETERKEGREGGRQGRKEGIRCLLKPKLGIISLIF